MKRFGLNLTLIAAIGAIAAVTLATGIVIYLTLGDLRDAANARTVARRATADLNDFLTAMLDQETGIRGYLLSGEKASLAPYAEGQAAQTRSTAKLEAAFANEDKLLTSLRAAEAAARGWQLAVAAPVVAQMGDPTRRAEAAQLEKSGESRRLFDQFRSRIQEMREEEDRRVQHYDDGFRRADALMGTVVMVGPALAVLFCFGVAFALARVVFQPLLQLVATMRRLSDRDLQVEVPKVASQTEVGEMARAVQAFKEGLIEIERTSVLRALADTVPALIGYIDKDRKVRFLNSAFGAWFSLPAADVTQVFKSPIEKVFAPVPLPGYPDQLNSALSGFQARVDHRFKRLDGAVRDIEAIYHPHRAPDGEVLGAVALLTDVTQRKDFDRRLATQARELKRSNEELEQFAYVASHDLKAPLRGIENLVTWIEEDISEHLQGETKTNMNLLHNRVHRLESLLNDLLEYSRAGRRGFTAETIDTAVLVRDLAALISPPAGFSIIADPDLPTITAPRAPLTQVFQNLMGNAVKHHDDPAHGTIHVSWNGRPDGTEFVVTDNGPGIPVRFHERVFGMFQTLKPRDEVEGSGMGLAIVKKLLEAQGGSVSLGVRDGRGLAVHFIWPTERREERE